jgi:hypothetical protein
MHFIRTLVNYKVASKITTEKKIITASTAPQVYSYKKNILDISLWSIQKYRIWVPLKSWDRFT